jgi:transcriptional regulator GlxA family with amidase domain
MTRAAAAGPETVGFLMVPSFTMISFASAIDALRLANYVTGKPLFSWKLYSPGGRPVAASNGIAVAVDGAYADLGFTPRVIVCAGLGVERQEIGPLVARLRKLAFYGATLGAICGGSYVLARAGLLNGYRCAVHWENSASFAEDFPDVTVTQELYEFDRNRFTAAGGTAALDMMLALIAARHGAEIAAHITDELIHHRMREPNERQRMELRARLGVAHPKLIAVVGEMEKRLEHPASCAELARTVKLSPRQLERLFQRYLATTPTRYYLGLRLARARHFLRQTSMPILSVGLACGFVSASHFSKCYSEHFGQTPTEERRGRRAPAVGALAAE